MLQKACFEHITQVQQASENRAKLYDCLHELPGLV